MEDLRSVLILDDDAEQAETLAKDFTASGRFVLTVTTRPSDEDLHAYLEVADFTVVDWNLDKWRTQEDENNGITGSQIAERLLNRVLAISGVPGVIFTQVDEAGVTAVLQRYAWFKSGLYPVVTRLAQKDAIKAIEDKAQAEADSVASAMLCLLWKPQLRKAVSAAVKEVSALSPDVLALFADGFSTDRLPYGWAARELLNRMLEQYLPAPEAIDRLFETVVRKRLDELTTPGKDNKKGRRIDDYLNVDDTVLTKYLTIESALRFIPGDKLESQPLDTGDIVEVDESRGVYGIVITPACDTVRLRSTKLLLGQDLYRRLKWRKPDAEPDLQAVIAEALKNPSDKEMWLFGVPIRKDETHLVFHYNWVHTVTTPRTKEDSTTIYADYEEDPRLKARWDAFSFPTSPYVPFGKRVARIRPPYIDDLMGNYARYQLRKGIPADPNVEFGQYLNRLVGKMRKAEPPEPGAEGTVSGEVAK